MNFINKACVNTFNVLRVNDSLRTFVENLHMAYCNSGKDAVDNDDRANDIYDDKLITM